MKTYKIYGNNVEWLEAREIKAESLEEAKEKYIELWEAGDLPVVESYIGDSDGSAIYCDSK